MFPSVFQRVEPATGPPRAAILATAGLFCVVTLLNLAGLFCVSLLYELAGQSLYVVYSLCVVAFVRLARSWPARAFGIATPVPVVVVTAIFGYGALYAAGVLLLGLLW